MRKALWCGYGAVCFTLMFFSALVVPGVAAERLPTPAPNPSTVEVAYDRGTGLISIQAHDTPLDAVLQELSKKVPFRIDSLQKELLNERITVELRHLSPEQALRKLLERFNAIFLYSSATDPRIRVMLLSRKATAPLEASTEPATAPESAHAVQALLETLRDTDIPARADTIAALTQDAPETAVGVLADWVQADDQQLRVFAAAWLGEVGGDRAIAPLSAALAGDDPLTRQIAANSLAHIGGDRAKQILIAAYRKRGNELKQAVATAIAVHGDDLSQATLASLLTGGQAPRGQTAQEVIVESLSQGAHGE
jgi:HEAT repeat protein